MSKLYRKTYNNCDDLPLYNFVKVITTDNYDYLIADKCIWKLKPDLQSSWENIFNDYIERIDDPKSKKSFMTIKEINVLANSISIAEQCISLLSKVESLDDYKPTIEALKSICAVYARFTKETLIGDLKQCLSKIKLMKLKHADALKEYKDIYQSKQEQVKESDFTQQIVVLEKFMGINIDMKTTSVAKYISYISTIKEHNNG